MTLAQYAKRFVEKALRVKDVFNEYVIKEIFIERFDVTIRRSMRKFWGTQQDTNLLDKAFHGTFLLRL